MMRRHDLTKELPAYITWIHDNLYYLTINCDTGQHLQFLQCFVFLLLCPRLFDLKVSLKQKYANHNDACYDVDETDDDLVFFFFNHSQTI